MLIKNFIREARLLYAGQLVERAGLLYSECTSLNVDIVEMQWSRNRRKWGLVRIAIIKNPNVLQAHSSLQAQSVT